MSFLGIEFGCLFWVCYLSSSVLYTLEKQKTLCFHRTVVRKIRRLGIFQIIQKLCLWHCFDWIFHFLWPVCVRVTAIFFFQLRDLHPRKISIHTVEGGGSLENEMKSHISKARVLWDRLVTHHKLNCFSHDGRMFVASCMPR